MDGIRNSKVVSMSSIVDIVVMVVLSAASCGSVLAPVSYTYGKLMVAFCRIRPD